MNKRLNPIIDKMTDNVLIKGKISWGELYSMYDGVYNEDAIAIDINNENYIGYNFNKPAIIEKYRIYPWYYGPTSGQVNCPTNWIFQGSDNLIDWTNIHTISNLNKEWGVEYKDFYIDNICKYKSYRLYNIKGYGYPGIFQLEFIGKFINYKSLIIQDNKIISLNDYENNKFKEIQIDKLNNEYFEKYGIDDLNIIFKKIQTKQDGNIKLIEKLTTFNSIYNIITKEI